MAISVNLSGCVTNPSGTKVSQLNKAREYLSRPDLINLDIFDSTIEISKFGIDVVKEKDAIYVSYSTNLENPYLFAHPFVLNNTYCKISQKNARMNPQHTFAGRTALGAGTPYLYMNGGQVVNYTKYADSMMESVTGIKNISKNQNNRYPFFEFDCRDYVINKDINPKQPILQPHFYIAESCTKDKIRQCNAILLFGETIKDNAFALARLDRDRYDIASAREKQKLADEKSAIEAKEKERIAQNQILLPKKSIVGTKLCFKSITSIYTPSIFIESNVEGRSGSRLQMRVATIKSLNPPSYTITYLDQYVLNGNQLKPNMVFWDDSINWELCESK